MKGGWVSSNPREGKDRVEHSSRRTRLAERKSEHSIREWKYRHAGAREEKERKLVINIREQRQKKTKLDGYPPIKGEQT